MNDQGRPTRAEPIAAKRETFTGNRGLAIEEPLLFEIGRAEISGVDVDVPATKGDRLGKHRRKAPIDLPALSEPEAMRHYVRLSQKNYAIDMGIYPLGSCTMKYNPRLNEAVARLPGFADIHPLQPASSVPGALELIHELGRWLIEITGMHSVAMTPKAGAHGELCGMMAIKAALTARGEARTQGAGAGIRRTAPTRRPRRCSAIRSSPFRRAPTARCGGGRARRSSRRTRARSRR